MGEMISMIAHQWRQPLTAITATTNNLQIKALIDEKIDTQQLQEELELITNYSQHLSLTIDDFRNFFKPDKIKTESKLEDIIEKYEEKNIEIILVIKYTHKRRLLKIGKIFNKIKIYRILEHAKIHLKEELENEQNISTK